MSGYTVVHRGIDFGEGPRWHEGRLWFSDFYRRAVYSWGEGGERLEVEIDDQPSGLGWMPDGTLLVVAMLSRRLLAIDSDGSVRVHAISTQPCSVINTQTTTNIDAPSIKRRTSTHHP